MGDRHSSGEVEAQRLLENTLFYAALLWLLICGPFALRRFIRVSRVRRGESDTPPLTLPRQIMGGFNANLPVWPIWPAFVLNTLFYAALLWLLVRGPFALRRLVRARRGLCPRCAYSMGESAVCSECGAELPSRTEAGTTSG